jgi:hypothetical protein
MNRQPELPNFIRDLEIEQSLQQFLPVPKPILDDEADEAEPPLS